MQQTIIKGGNKSLNLNLNELVQYKDLLFTLALRDFKVRYAQTFLGLLWGILQPLMTLLVFILVFHFTVKVDTGKIPYPLFALAGMCSWNYFSNVMSGAGNSIIGAQGMIQKIYFPRLIIPLSKALVGLIDLAIVLIMFFILMIIYRYPLSVNIIFLPLFLLISIISSLAVGIWLSALTIRYRDFQFIVPFMVQFGLYATPIAYPVTLAKKQFQWIFYLNPMTGVVQGFRWCLLGTEAPNYLCYISFAFILLLFVSSLFYFKKTERIMADIV